LAFLRWDQGYYPLNPIDIKRIAEYSAIFLIYT
jgi:hypothetical protein